MKAYIDISPYWPKNEEGKPKTVNAVYTELLGTPYALSRNTLKQALDGNFDRAKIINLVKLAGAASLWQKTQLGIDDLLKVEESN